MSYGVEINDVLQAARLLEERGVEAEVVKLNIITPLDAAPVLDSVRRTGALLVAEDNTDITGFDALEGKRAAQNLTSSWGQEAEGCGAELVSVDSVAEGIELILSGRADCMLNAETAFYDYMNKHPDAPVKIVAATDTTTSSQIPVPKGNERLVEAINEALDDMCASGQLAQLSEQYFGADVTSE